MTKKKAPIAFAVLTAATLATGCTQHDAISPLTYKGVELKEDGYKPMTMSVDHHPGTPTAPNATAFFTKVHSFDPKDPKDLAGAEVGTVVGEESGLKQVTGALRNLAGGTGDVLTGLGVNKIGNAAIRGKFQDTTNINQSTSTEGTVGPINVEGSTATASGGTVGDINVEGSKATAATGPVSVKVDTKVHTSATAGAAANANAAAKTPAPTTPPKKHGREWFPKHGR